MSTDEREALKKAESARKHTQEWYARHYGKLHDWARKRLPEPWRTEFFNCVANGTWGHEDTGQTYVCKAGFSVTLTNYFRTDTAEGQLILDQTRRAEEAEIRIAELEAECSRLREENEDYAKSFDLYWKCGQRATAYWREKTGKELTVPDTTALLKWLMDQIAERDAQLKAAREALTGTLCSCVKLDECPQCQSFSGLRDVPSPSVYTLEYKCVKCGRFWAKSELAKRVINYCQRCKALAALDGEVR